MENKSSLSPDSDDAGLAEGRSTAEARTAHHESSSRSSAEADTVEADSLASLGIERIRADQYLVNGFRYTMLGDAVAEARRRAAS